MFLLSASVIVLNLLNCLTLKDIEKTFLHVCGTNKYKYAKRKKCKSWSQVVKAPSHLRHYNTSNWDTCVTFPIKLSNI